MFYKIEIKKMHGQTFRWQSWKFWNGYMYVHLILIVAINWKENNEKNIYFMHTSWIHIKKFKKKFTTVSISRCIRI